MPAPKGNKYAKGNKGGRPTVFKARYAKEIVKFFDIEPYRSEVMKKSTEYYPTGKVKSKKEESQLIANRLPTLFRFSQKIGVVYSTVWRWAEKGDWEKEDGKTKQPPKEFQEFCNAYKAAKEIQKEFLIALGLSGSSPPSSYIFTAKNITDMRDRLEQDITSGGRPIPILGSIEIKKKK